MNLPKKSNLVFDHRYFLGSLRDFSGNNNSGVGTGISFQKKSDKHVVFEGTDKITISDSSELQLTEGTIIVYGEFDSDLYTANNRIVSKRDAGGVNYEMLFTSNAVLSVYDGTNTRNATINWDGARSIACSFTSGSTPKAYKNGAFVTDFDDTVTVTVDDADIIIGNLYTGNYGCSPLKGVLIYNTILTDEEIAQVHEWIMATKTPKYPKKNFVYPSLIPEGKDTSYGSQLLTDGDMEAAGTTAWPSIGIRTPTIEKVTISPHNGVRNLKVTNVGATECATLQTILTAGKKYRVTGWGRGDGSSTYPRLFFQGTQLIWGGTTSNNWQYFDEVATAGTGEVTTRFYSKGVDGGYAEWDDVTITEVRETVAAYDMKSVHGKIIDKTGNGNDASLTAGGINQSKAIGGLSALTFNDDTYFTLASNIDFTAKDFTISCLVKTGSQVDNYNPILNAGNYEVYFGINSTEKLQIYTNNSDTLLATNALPVGKWVQIMWVHKQTGNDEIFYNNNLEGSGSKSDPTSAELTTIGGSSGLKFTGSVADLRVYNYALSSVERADLYNKYAKLPTFIDDLKDANESIVAEGGAIGAPLSNTEWKFGDATAKYKISRDSIDALPASGELVVGGVLYTGWTAGNSATLTNPTSDVLRVTRSSGWGEASQAILTSGKRYRVKAEGRSDGTATGSVQFGSVTVATISDSTSWQEIDAVGETDAAAFDLGKASAGGEYIEFRNVEVYEIDGNDKVIECTTAGVLYHESQQAYGTFEWDIYKGGASNSLNVLFTADTIGAASATGQDANGFFFNADERMGLVASVNGNGATPAYTATAYADNNAWYKIRYTRRYDGSFTMYIKGGAFTDWTLIDVSGGTGTNPITNNNTTTSKYVVLDLDAGDKVANLKFYNGVMTP